MFFFFGGIVLLYVSFFFKKIALFDDRAELYFLNKIIVRKYDEIKSCGDLLVVVCV